MNLTQRGLLSVSWNMLARLANFIMSTVRLVLLSRWIPVEVFGVYGLASAIISLTAAIPIFGMNSAFIHRTQETKDKDKAAAVHFTLQWIFTSVWGIIVLIIALIFSSGQNRLAIIVLMVTTYGMQLTQTPQLILMREVNHKRISFIQIISVIFGTPIALILAWKGIPLWALLSESIFSFNSLVTSP